VTAENALPGVTDGGRDIGVETGRMNAGGGGGGTRGGGASVDGTPTISEESRPVLRRGDFVGDFGGDFPGDLLGDFGLKCSCRHAGNGPNMLV
jgi:hypothetical protein